MATRPHRFFQAIVALILAGALAGCGHTKRSPDLPPLDKLGSLDIHYGIDVSRRTGNGYRIDSARMHLTQRHFLEALEEWKAGQAGRIGFPRQAQLDRECSDEFDRLLGQVHAFEPDSIEVDSLALDTCLSGAGEYVLVIKVYGTTEEFAITAKRFARDLAVSLVFMSPVVSYEMSKNITVKALIVQPRIYRLRYFDMAGSEVDPTRKDKVRKFFRAAVAGLEIRD